MAAAVKRFYVASLRDKAHYHGCPKCLSRWSCACGEPEYVGPCTNCRLNRSGSLLVVKPQPCCLRPENTRRARPDERASYKLAGDHAWLICKVCFRQQPCL